MKEVQRHLKLFKDLYNGDPWLDENLVKSLSSLSAETAARRLIPGCNTVWEITNHLISWRRNVLARVQGKIIQTPAHNYFQRVLDTSEDAWKDTLTQLDETQNNWLEFLKDFDEDNYDNIYSSRQMSFFDHMHGILHHDAYHLGQINLLLKFK